MEKTRNDVFNFNAGPAALPTEALERAQAELVNFQGSGISIMEASHRSKLYEDVHNQAKALLVELLGVPSGYDVLFLQGGASLQFAMLPMNFTAADRPGAYVMTGSWADRAYSEAKLAGGARVAASAEAYAFQRTPGLAEIITQPGDAYLHVTSNETIGGLQWPTFPDPGAVPLVADMSSDILSRPIDVGQFGMIYAGAQKNLGPSGVTVVIVKSDWLAQANADVPVILRYSTHAKNNSLYNTPPTFAVYLLSCVLEWAKALGGMPALQQLNERKAGVVYDAIDNSDGFYRGYVETAYRSRMNITFGLRTPELEQAFLTAAKDVGFLGLNGHRSVGGCRASTYNAVPQAACDRLAQFMADFRRTHQ